MNIVENQIILPSLFDFSRINAVKTLIEILSLIKSNNLPINIIDVYILNKLYNKYIKTYLLNKPDTYNLIKKLENTRSLKLKMIPNNISEQLLENVDQYEPKKSFFGKLRNKITRKTSSNVFGTKQAQGKMSSSNQSTNKPEQYPTNTKKQGASSLRRMVLGDAAVNLGTGMPATEMQNTTRTQPIHNPVYEGL